MTKPANLRPTRRSPPARGWTLVQLGGVPAKVGSPRRRGNTPQEINEKMAEIAHAKLRSYAERARRAANLNAIILFGSRSRGTAHSTSDWDLCIIGGASERAAIEEVEKAIPETVISDDIDLLWIPDVATLQSRASAGTIWAHIAADGTVIAGDPDMLQQVQIKPMKPDNIRERLNIVMGKIGQATQQIDAKPNEDRWQKDRRMWTATESTAHAAKTLTWLLAGFADVQQSWPHHHINRSAEAAQEQAQAVAEKSRIGITLATLARRISAVNGASSQARRVLYDRNLAEDQSVWEKRLVEVLRGTQQLLDGCVRGEGPLRELQDEARHAGLTSTFIEEAARMADESESWLSRTTRPNHGAWAKIAKFARSMRTVAATGQPNEPPTQERSRW